MYSKFILVKNNRNWPKSSDLKKNNNIVVVDFGPKLNQIDTGRKLDPINFLSKTAQISFWFKITQNWFCLKLLKGNFNQEIERN